MAEVSQANSSKDFQKKKRQEIAAALAALISLFFVSQ